MQASDSASLKPPPYVTYATFTNFLRSQKEKGLPSQVDKSVLKNLSGGAQSALMASLRWLGLIDVNGVPTKALEGLVEASDTEAYKDTLRRVLEESQYNLLANPDFDISRATAQQLEGKLKEFGGQGSTVLKSMAFFISAAKDAGVNLSPHIKVPSQPQTNRKVSRKSVSDRRSSQEAPQEPQKGVLPNLGATGDFGSIAGYLKIAIPIHGMKEGAVYLPDGLSKPQWEHALKMTKFILENYRMDDLLGDSE